MNNPFTTIQNWIDERRAKKNRELVSRCGVGQRIEEDELNVINSIHLAIASGSGQVFEYCGVTYKAVVVDENENTVSIELYESGE